MRREETEPGKTKIMKTKMIKDTPHVHISPDPKPGTYTAGQFVFLYPEKYRQLRAAGLPRAVDALIIIKSPRP